ncbi:MAG: DUF4259 domain-containing protein [Lachnospiraceae bacterium]|nr:DUF4259 domain-containing protein [Lachnospiraceae bacterium]
MGAWDYQVLTNDSALDLMTVISKTQRTLKNCIKTVFKTSSDVHELLLMVEIVDISLNGLDEDILGGFYGYEKWFEEIRKNPLTELKNDAIRTIKHIQEIDSGWVDDCKEQRKELLIKIEKRLKG